MCIRIMKNEHGAIHASTVTRLCQANDGEILMPNFFANIQNLILKVCLYPVMLPWQ